MSKLSTTELSDISSPKSHLTSTMGIRNLSCSDNNIRIDHDESSTITRQTQLLTRPATSSNITGDTTCAKDTLSRSDTLSIICSFSPHRNFLHQLYARESAEDKYDSFKLANGKHIDTTMVRDSIRFWHFQKLTCPNKVLIEAITKKFMNNSTSFNNNEEC